jgi:pheromone shutdown protein TraB
VTTENDLLIATLNRIESKVDEARITAAVTAAKMDGIAEDLRAHVEGDKAALAALDKRLKPLETLRTKILMYSAIAATAIGIAVGAAKDALASAIAGWLPPH